MLSIIAAINRKNVIGKENKLPWHLPEDLKRFKEMTSGHIIIMGRCTYESIGRPLPNRTTIVVTKQEFWKTRVALSPNIIVVSTPLEAIHMTNHCGERFIVGGAKLYESTISLANKMYLTHVNDESDGDTFFPEFNREDWMAHDSGPIGERHLGHWVETLTRKNYR